MTPQKQNVFNDFKNGKYGNCMQACIASLFNLPIEQVPHFMMAESYMMDAISDFCNKNGYKFSGIKQKPTEMDLNNFKGIDGYYMVGGKSPRNKYGHAVIYKNGQPFFDVHPDNTFTRTVDSLYLITRR